MTDATLRRRAKQLGYLVSKGFWRWTSGPVFRDWSGETRTGYNISNMNNLLVWGSSNGIWDHQFTKEDVIDFLKEEDVEGWFKW